ncbi:MAG TPA: HAMP domain-containing histidine kinase [Epsilonproteobacteria bacterium]|nr:HAMP domain-containing histidine kinase [Campylobacterota bacterium]
MSFLDNFLTSGHYFDEKENLAKFRFSLLNSLLLIATFFTVINCVASIFNFITFTNLYEKLLFVYVLINIFSIYLLRKDKNMYFLTVNIILISSLFIFYAALITAPTDEFRLIWFFLVLFTSFLLLGKKYSLLLMLFMLSSIFATNFFIMDLGYSRLALFTFFNSFIIFTAFAYFFLDKIEKDALEFHKLNTRLKDKVSMEVQQRQVQEKMLLQQSRLAGMGEMMDSIAHQWRQPLMNINAILMNMERGIETKAHPKAYLEKKMDEVITLTTHMSQTIEDFRSLLKTEKQKTHFFIDKSIDSVLELYEASLKNIEVHVIPTKGKTFYGYNNEFIQVIMILLHNAIDILHVRNIKEKRIFITVSVDDNHLSLYIEDNAKGISKKVIHKIFDPYFTTKQVTGGTGLGLYIAKIIIEQNMQGTLTVTNTNKGAKFHISLPNG